MIVSVVGTLGSGKTYLIQKIEEYMAKMGVTTVRYSMADPVKYLAFHLYGFYKYQEESKIRLRNPSPDEIKEGFVNYFKKSANPKFAKTIKREWKRIEPFFVDKEYCTLRRNILNENDTKLACRRVLQFIGTDIGREIDNDIWANLAANFIRKVFENNPHSCVLIDDMRFMNEYVKLSTIFGNPNVYIIRRESSDEELMRVFNCSQTELDKMKNHPSEWEWQNIPYQSTIKRLSEEDLDKKAFKLAENFVGWTFV